jgi:hypothetical protein
MENLLFATDAGRVNCSGHMGYHTAAGHNINNKQFIQNSFYSNSGDRHFSSTH